MTAMNVNGTVHALKILRGADTPAWLDEFAAQLSSTHHYHVSMAAPNDSLRTHEKSKPVEAVIGAQTPEIIRLFEGLRARTEGQGRLRPLLVMIVKGTPELPTDLPADMILDCNSAVWHIQLTALLRMRRQQQQLLLEQQNNQKRIKKLEMELKQQQRSKNELLLLKSAIVRNVSHELKTPLLHVKSAVALLAEDLGEGHKLVGYAANATTRLEALVNNIVQLATSLEIARGPVIPTESLDQALRNLRRSWEHRDQISRVKIVRDERLPLVLADKQSLGTALQLLIDNALKFSTSDVTITLRREKDRVCFLIRDEGIGIAKDQLNRIFESFYQIDNSSTRAYGGMGIGLTIVAYILERHKAKIQVKSKPGKGSTFIFCLPVVELQG